MPRRIAVPLITIGLLISGGALVHGQTNAAMGRVYRLDHPSTYQRGCFPPCLCPMMESGTVRGAFRLVPAATGDVFQFYTVQDVHWVVDLPTSPLVHRVRGSGTYKIHHGTSMRVHQMTLDLAIDQNVTQQFDSGLVQVTTPFPKIDITVSINGIHCQDTVFTLHARPLLWLDVSPSVLSWGAIADATGYDIVRGDLGVLHESGGNLAAATVECLVDGETELSLAYAATPAPGHGFYFLARSEAGQIQETWDEGDVGQILSRDPALENSAGSCP